MKKTKLLLLLALLAAGFTACTDPIEPGTSVGTGVSFKLDLEDTEIVGNAVAALYPDELQFSEVQVVLFDASGMFHSVVKPASHPTGYQFGVPAGAYRMYVIANVTFDKPLAELLVVGTSTPDDLKRLVVSQELGTDKTMPMITEDSQEFTYTTADQPVDMGTLELHRLAARIDVVNSIPALTINKVEVKNLVSQSLLFPTAMPTGTDYFKSQTFEDLSIAGNASKPTTLNGIYSYENTSTNKTAVTVSYTFGGEARTFDYTFDKLEGNTLYTVQFAAYEDGINYQAVTWANATQKGVQVFGSRDIQIGKNKALAVAHFTPLDVKEMDGLSGLISFVDPDDTNWGRTDLENAPAGWNDNRPAFRNWNSAYQTSTYIDADGNKYRLPTRDEMSLIAPASGVAKLNTPGEAMNVTEELSDLFGIVGSGGRGTSDFRYVQTNVWDANANYVSCYAIRFRNTDQCAAYRYRMTGSGRDAAVSVRVKALGLSFTETLDDVCKETYWDDAEQDLEFIFRLNGKGDAGNSNRGQSGQWWTTTEDFSTYADNPTLRNVYYMEFGSSGAGISESQKNSPFNLRMVYAD